MRPLSHPCESATFLDCGEQRPGNPNKDITATQDTTDRGLIMIAPFSGRNRSPPTWLYCEKKPLQAGGYGHLCARSGTCTSGQAFGYRGEVVQAITPPGAAGDFVLAETSR